MQVGWRSSVVECRVIVQNIVGHQFELSKGHCVQERHLNPISNTAKQNIQRGSPAWQICKYSWTSNIGDLCWCALCINAELGSYAIMIHASCGPNVSGIQEKSIDFSTVTNGRDDELSFAWFCSIREDSFPFHDERRFPSLSETEGTSQGRSSYSFRLRWLVYSTTSFLFHMLLGTCANLNCLETLGNRKWSNRNAKLFIAKKQFTDWIKIHQHE